MLTTYFRLVSLGNKGMKLVETYAFMGLLKHSEELIINNHKYVVFYSDPENKAKVKQLLLDYTQPNSSGYSEFDREIGRAFNDLEAAAIKIK